jgi:hypothetical protein
MPEAAPCEPPARSPLADNRQPFGMEAQVLHLVVEQLLADATEQRRSARPPNGPIIHHAGVFGRQQDR